MSNRPYRIRKVSGYWTLFHAGRPLFTFADLASALEATR
jgi:hypothetical protein